jgi:hypothetical protein
VSKNRMPGVGSGKGYVSMISQIGWADCRAGRPYRREYDSWQELDQRNYENGRLRAAGAALVWKRVPKQQTEYVVKTLKAHDRGFIPPSRIIG